MEAIQKLADGGTLVLMIYKNDKTNPDTGNLYDGHIAFVGNSNLQYNTVYLPSKETPIYKKGEIIKNNISYSSHLPIVVQAGTYTGVTSMVYATNGWTDNREKLLKNNLSFYTVKRN